MKKLLLYSLFLIVSGSLNAQHTGFYSGLNAAIQSCWILNSEDSDASGELDFENTFKQAFGLDLGYKFNSQMGIQTGVIYSQQGQNYLTNGNKNANYKTDLTYLKFPILLCYQLRAEKRISFIFQAGFQLSLLTEAKSSRMNTFGIYSPAYIDVKKSYNSLPIELVLAAGLQYNYHKWGINLLVRPDYSISDIEKTDAKKNLRSPTSNLTLAIPQLGIQYYFK